MAVTRKFLCLLTLALFLALPLAAVGAQDVDFMDPATFGLDASKPYDGTQLNFLICCSTAPQFASAAVKGAEEFTAMTGISVSWGDLPFGSFQEQLYLEATNPNTEFDVVAFVDAWGTNIYDFLHPLNDFVEDAGFDWDDYGPAYQGAATGMSDTIYGMPFRGHPLLLHYRADVLEAVGMGPAGYLARHLGDWRGDRSGGHGYRACRHVLRLERGSESLQLVCAALGRRH